MNFYLNFPLSMSYSAETMDNGLLTEKRKHVINNMGLLLIVYAVRSLI